ncbi:MAG: hypothetical protein WAL95_04885 [Candidatus Acidiferrales bacterium]
MDAQFVSELRAELQAMIRAAIEANPYKFIIVAVEHDEQTAAKHEWERDILRESEGDDESA